MTTTNTRVTPIFKVYSTMTICVILEDYFVPYFLMHPAPIQWHSYPSKMTKRVLLIQMTGGQLSM